MYRESREKRSSRSRSRERRAIGDPDLDAVKRAQREGNVQLQKQANASKMPFALSTCDRVPVEENPVTFDLEFRRSSTKKDRRTQIKALIDKEITKEMEIRRSSPSLVARLMGLDTLPPLVAKQQKERGIGSQKTSSVGLHKKHTGHDGYHHRTSSNEYQECKDVFEVVEMPKVERQNDKSFQKGLPSLEQNEIDLKSSNKDMNFTKQKFMDAADLPTDDEFLYIKEYNDALEDLDPNKDLFMKFLQEPNSLFKKHLQDLKCSPPSPHASHITILKPANVAKSDNELSGRSERNAERHHRLLKGDISSCRRPVSNLVRHPVKKQVSSLPCESLEPLYAGKTKVQPSQIVVLKPSLEKVLGTEITVPLSRPFDSHQYVLKSQRRIPMSRKSEVYAGQRDRSKLSESEEVMRHKRLREIARDITKQLRTSGSSDSKLMGSRKYGYTRGGSSRGMPAMENLNLESLRRTSDELNECSGNLSTPSYYSTESSVSREARKRLSERWKMIQQIQGVQPLDKGSNTLGEMLVSERETPRTTLNRSIIQNASREKVFSREAIGRWDYPLGTRNKDGRKDGCPRNLSRSKSLPISSSGYGNHEPSRRNSVGVSNKFVLSKSLNDSLVRNDSQRRKPSTQSSKYHYNNAPLFSGREESELFEREIHVNSEKLHSRIYSRNHAEEVSIVAEPSNDSVADRGHECGDLPLTVDIQQVQQPANLAVPVNGGELSVADPDFVTRKETSANHSQVNFISSHSDKPESLSPVSSKEDQPSPVSVLEPPPLEEDKSSSECFKKISAGLKDLRMQLKLLKLESADTDAEDLELVISSDEEDIGGECHSPLNSVEIQAFRDEVERDFSYLVDVLIASGIHCTSVDGLLNACYVQEYPVGRDVFEKLEKKYNALTSWSRSERKLLFDLISSILGDIIVPSVDLRSMKSKSRCTWARESLFDNVWQLVVMQRKELSGQLEEKLLLDARWLDLVDDVEMVGRELETLLIDDLMEELVSQLD